MRVWYPEAGFVRDLLTSTCSISIVVSDGLVHFERATLCTVVSPTRLSAQN